MQGKTEGAMKISASRASKWAPTWHSCMITPKSLSGQPLDQVWIRRSRGWPERDFGVIVQLCHVGARFEALDALIFIAPSVSPCIFFTSLDFPLEQCAKLSHYFELHVSSYLSPYSISGYQGLSKRTFTYLQMNLMAHLKALCILRWNMGSDTKRHEV